jgi:hypothetical protein
MEQDISYRNGYDTEVWKIRSAHLLLLTGPCALGMAVNEVLGRNSLEKIDHGWISSHVWNGISTGHTKILLVRSR